MYKFNPDFYADIRIEDKFSTNIVYKNGVRDSLTVRKTKRAFIRVYDGKMWYYASTCELNDIQNELDGLYAQATPNPNIANDPIVKKFEVNVATEMKFIDKSVRDVSEDEKVALIEGAIPLIKAPNLALAQMLYLDKSNNYEFYSSKGADIKYDYQLCGLIAVALLAKEGGVVQAFIEDCKPSFSELGEYKTLFPSRMEKYFDFSAHAKPCKKGKFPVILSPMAAGMFAHESFGHKSEADFMLGDEKMIAEWQLGKQVGSEILNIVDDGKDFGSGYVPYDDDGTKNKKTYLIKNGILCGRLHSAITAAALNEELTGNSRAVDATFEPIVRMTNTYIEHGNSTLEELIAGIKEGYLVEDVSHGSGGSTFTIAPSLAYEIIDGKLGGPVEISVVTGDLFKTLYLIDGLTDKVVTENNITGGCGKMEQFPLHVADGGPYVRVKELNVQ